MTKPKHVVIIGGGISGLVCAHRLKQRGLNVTILEASHRVGGTARTVAHQEGFLCETGPDGFRNTAEMTALIREVGLADELIMANASLPRFVYCRRRLQPVPTTLGAVLTTPLLGLGSRLRALREYYGKSSDSASEETLHQFVSRRFGSEAAQNFADPFASGFSAGDPRRLSVNCVYPDLPRYEKEHGSVLKGLLGAEKRLPESRQRYCSFQQGIQTLPRRLGESIGKENIELGMRARKILPMPRGDRNSFHVRVSIQEAERDVYSDAVVLAAPAYRTAEVLKPLSPAIASELSSIEHPPLVVLSLGYKKTDVAHPLHGFGFWAPRAEGLGSLGCVWNSSLFARRAPQDHVLLTVYIGGVTYPAVEGLGDDKILNAVRNDLRAALGIIIAPEVPSIHRYDRAAPQYAVGHQRKVLRIEEELKKLPGLFLTGNYIRGFSVEDCVREALDTSKRVEQYLTQG